MSVKGNRNFRISFVDSNSGVWNVERLDQFEINGPDSIVLSDGQRTQSSVASLPGSSDETLIEQKLTIITPNPRHFVHISERSFINVVHFFILCVIDRLRL